MTQIILVDGNDNQIGAGEKLKVHQEGRLHRAFSVLIFNSKNEVLLQKRARGKYHSGGLWSNTCCSHPIPSFREARAKKVNFLLPPSPACGTKVEKRIYSLRTTRMIMKGRRRDLSLRLTEEDMKETAQRRLKEEMGIETGLKEIFSFIYRADFGDLTEHEFDHVFVGRFDGNPNPNPEEAEDWKWINLAELKKDVKENPQNYTYWSKIIFDKIIC